MIISAKRQSGTKTLSIPGFPLIPNKSAESFLRIPIQFPSRGEKERVLAIRITIKPCVRQNPQKSEKQLSNQKQALRAGQSRETTMKTPIQIGSTSFGRILLHIQCALR